MALDLHIIVTCTKRKTQEVPSALRLRTIRGSDVSARARAWLQRIRTSTVQRIPAEELYAGDHWSIARMLPSIASAAGFRPSLWVISTGFGLVPAKAKIFPYSATFSHTHPDSVSKTRRTPDGMHAFAQWWDVISEWDGPSPGMPRTIQSLAAASPNAAFLVVASEAYLAAVAADLERASSILHHRERLAIISGGTRQFGTLSDAVIPLDARLQAALGGARRTLNVRMARRVLGGLKNPGFNVRDLRVQYARLLTRQPAIILAHRQRRTDEQVRSYVRQQLRKDRSGTPSGLLALLRARGFACEQSRFHRLFDEASEGLNGHA